MRCLTRGALPCLLATVLASSGVQAQEGSPSSEERGSGGPIIVDSTVGYIDPAIPATLARLRFDSAVNNIAPNRGEFFYATGADGRGLPRPERSVDYQEMSAYLELSPCDRFSAFIDVPIRLLNPDINENHGGLSDISGGFKYAFLFEPDRALTLQMKVLAPTGAASRGLGTGHPSVEPGLLFYQRWSPRMAIEGELKAWVPIAGTADFAGPVIRYGLGTHYDLIRYQKVKVAPVLEVVGWTFLDGRKTVGLPSGLFVEQSAAGDTIINVKLGVRLTLGSRCDLYTGYGRAVTGETFYSDVVRAELRLRF